MQIANNSLEETFFTAGDNLDGSATTQFNRLVAAEDRRRGLKALIVTGAILVLAIVLLALLLPAPTSPSAHREPEQGAAL